MNSQQFDALVAKAQAEADKDPKGYKRKVGLLAYLGYLYIGTVMSVLFFGAFALIVLAVLVPKAVTVKLALKLGLALLALFVMALQALWVRLSPPEGKELTEADAPELFALLREYETKLNAEKIHKVLLDERFNCGVVQVPMFGLVGFHKSYLTLGLPMLQAITPSQLRAVLAHEFGHLSGNHSKFAAWIYRVRQTYITLLTSLHDNRSWGTFMFEKFFSWYSPYFSAYSFVLARADEYEADSCSVQLTTKRDTADALVNIEIKAEYYNKHFWPKVYEEAKVHDKPLKGIYHYMGQALAKGVTPVQAKDALDGALKVKTTTSDTHPCLTDRLKALQIPMQEVTVSVARPLEQSAADFYLVQSLSRFTEEFSTLWEGNIRNYWGNLHQEYARLKGHIMSYEDKYKTSGLNYDEQYKYAVTLMDYSGNDSAVPVLQELIDKSPLNNKARFTLGSILLAKNDSSGIALMDRIVQDEPDYLISACEDLYGYFYRQGDMQSANQYLAKLESREEHIWKAESEAADFKPNDNLIPHDLKHEDLEPVLAEFPHYPELQEVYLVKKVLNYDPAYPVYLFGLVRKGGMIELDGEEKDIDLQNNLSQTPSPIASFYMTVSGHRKDMLKALKKIDGSLIYQKS